MTHSTGANILSARLRGSISILALGFAMLAGGSPHHAWAAETDTGTPVPLPEQTSEVTNDGKGLETVIVTAERRKENLQDTPVAVTAFTPAQIEQSNAQSIRSLGMQATSLYIPRSSINPSTAAYFIRGVGEADAVQSGAVGIYVDDVYLPRGLGSNYEFGDLESIEILRGPQGTLYGRNSAAGAVKIHTGEPKDEFHFYQENGIGNYGQFIDRSGINVPINDWIDLSLDYVHRQRDGTTHNIYDNNDTRDIDSNSAQLKVLFKLSDSVKFLFNARGLLDNSTGGSVGSSVFVPGGVLAQLGITSVQPRTNYSEYPNSTNHMQEALAAGTLTWQVDADHVFKSITSYQELRQPGQYDTDLTPAILSELTLHHRDHVTTQEFQFTGNEYNDQLNYVTGLYLYHETFDSYRITTSARNGGVVTATAQLGTERINSLAPYGQATYKLTDDVDLTAGARYTFEHRFFRFTYGTITPAYTLANSNAEHSWDSFTPKLGVDYHLTPSNLIYASFSQGFKAGGYDNRSNSLLAATKPYDTETVDSWEVGVKNELFDHRLRVNVATFYNDYSNFQATASDPTTGTALRVNAGDAVTKGIELETTWRVANGVTWTNNASWLSALVTRSKGLLSDGTNTQGHRLPDSPRWALTSSIDYAPDLNIPGGTVILGAAATYQSVVYTDLQNSSIGEAPAQPNFDLNISYVTDDGHWFAGFTVQNLLNSTFSQGGSLSGTGKTAYATTNYNEPRLVLARLKYTY